MEATGIFVFIWRILQQSFIERFICPSNKLQKNKASSYFPIWAKQLGPYKAVKIMDMHSCV